MTQQCPLRATTELAATMLRIQHADDPSALRSIDKAIQFLREDGTFMVGNTFIRVASRRDPTTMYGTCLTECTCPSWTERCADWRVGAISYPWCWHLALIRIVWIERALDLCITPTPPDLDPTRAPEVLNDCFLNKRKYTQAEYDAMMA